MYGKFFASAFTGSMYGAGSDVFAVWAYVIANTKDSQVEINPALLAGMLGSTPERVRGALDFLCAPDPNSRSKAEDGRRLVREGEFAYRVPNFTAYRSIRNEEERRAYNRQKKAESRQRQADVKAPVIEMSAVSAHTEAEAEADPEAGTASAPRARRVSRTPKGPTGTAPRQNDTWLTPYLDLWNDAGGAIQAGEMAKALRGLDTEFGSQRVTQALRAYLAEGQAKYGIHVFARSWRDWEAKGNGLHLSDRERRSAAAMQDFAQETS